MNNVKVDNKTFNAIMLNKKRCAPVYVGTVKVGDVITFERQDGSSTVRRQVSHIDAISGVLVASIAPVSGGMQ